MTPPTDPEDRNKALANAGLKFAAVIVLVMAIFYASQYAAYTFMTVFAG
ncbi:hypothetical protein [Pelagibacterium limicola]|nr:hypothetical protein [Pelagibacterium limicola]